MTNAAELATEYLDLQSRKADLDVRIDQVKAQLRDLGTGAHQAGPYQVRITTQRRFDTTLAEAILSPEQYAALCTGFDTKQAKATLPPALYDACCAESGDPRVSVK
jgi:hypothetical protein